MAMFYAYNNAMRGTYITAKSELCNFDKKI